MRSAIYWIAHVPDRRLGIMARPRAADWLADEIRDWQSDGVTVVLSLLEPEEVSDFGLADEARLCRAAGIEFLTFPIPDRGVPESVTETLMLVARLSGYRSEGGAVAVHCRAGIGRSSLMAGAVLVYEGADADEAFAAITRARGLIVPDTDEQRDWLRAFQQRISEW